MPDINCCFPITVRLMGDLSDQELEDLGIVLERTLVGRIAFAEQTLATNDSTLAYDGERSLVREDYDPSREGATTYWVPTYQAKGQPTRVPLQGGTSALARRPWFIRKASNFHARVGEYLDYVEGLRPDRSLPEKVLYIDLFGDLRWVSVWLVQVNRPMRATELQPILYRRAAELSRIQSNQLLAYGHGFTEGARQQLIDIDEDGVVTRDIPDMTRNTTYIKLEGTDHQLRPGSWVLTTTMVLPKIELADVATLDPEIRVLMRLRDLTFLVPEVVFERETGVAWATYIDEFGDVTVTMRIQPITAKRRIHFLALQYLVGQLQGCLDRPEHGSQVGLLVVDPEWIRLDEGADLWLDVAELEKAAALTHGIPSDSLPPESVRALQNAVELYQGNLLESCYADWCLFERERLQSMYLAMLDKLMGCCEARHEYETGTLYGERILRCDRARERAHRRLMRLLYLAGDRSAALRQYERCSAILEEELGVKPARSTLALYDQIRNDRLEPTAAHHEDRTGQAQPAWDAPAWPNLSGDLEQLQKALREIERSIQQGIHLVDRALKEAG